MEPPPPSQSSRPPSRGSLSNPSGRFERLVYEPDGPTDAQTKTTFYRDHAQQIITYNKSPDIGFGASINPYRGCEHGCSYCYARPNHEYLGLSAGRDFEQLIFVKEAAPELLRRELLATSWNAQAIAISGVTDAYQPIEKTLGPNPSLPHCLVGVSESSRHRDQKCLGDARH